MEAEVGPQVTVTPSAFRQFGTPADTFCLVVDEESMTDFALAPAEPYAKSIAVPIGPDGDLSRLLESDIPESADVVVICRKAFLSSPDASVIGAGRRIVALPCASTPVTLEQVRYFLRVIGRTDPAAQEERANRFFDAVSRSPEIKIVDGEHGTSCDFDPVGGDYVWNQQAGILGPAEQQIAPAGELSVLPMDITEFDGDRRLALNGTLTLQGWPIVHAGYDKTLEPEQAELYERLTPLHRIPIVATVEDGVITGVKSHADTEEGTEMVAFLEELFAEEPRYRTIWELGFGINNGMEVFPGNCGLNEVYGADDGVVHFGMGLTPWTKFALTFICPTSSLVDGDGGSILGSRKAQPQKRRVNRVRSASCGCH